MKMGRTICIFHGHSEAFGSAIWSQMNVTGLFVT